MDAVELDSTDPKEASVEFLWLYSKSHHHFSTIKAAMQAWASSAPCLWHKTACVAERDPCHIYVAGPPCSPYSTQRSTRREVGCPM